LLLPPLMLRQSFAREKKEKEGMDLQTTTSAFWRYYLSKKKRRGGEKEAG